MDAVMSSPVRSKACSFGAAERRQQHREVERQALVRAVEGLVVELALLDPLDMGAENRAHAALTEERLGPRLAGGQETALAEDHATDPEVTELVLVGEVDDLGQVAHPGARSSCSTFKAYSNAAPSQVQVPWPMPMTSR
jgi:hypothetical protein